jgi:citrate lyase subunit beta/citryl-CoA lyase
LTRLLDRVQPGVSGDGKVKLQALVETPTGLANLSGIAASSERLEALIIGYADLAAAFGRQAPGSGNLSLWLATQESVLVAARANDLQAIDGPFLGIADDEPFQAATRQAKEMGFDGKWAIHPAQVATLNTFFTPSDGKIGWAHAVIDALGAGAGAVQLDGVMIDEAVRKAAERILSRAERRS